MCKRGVTVKSRLLILDLWFLFHPLTVLDTVQKPVVTFLSHGSCLGIRLYGQFVFKMWIQL